MLSDFSPGALSGIAGDDKQDKRRRKQKQGLESHGPPAAAGLTTWIVEPETFAPIGKIVGDKKFGIVNDHLGSPLAMYAESRKLFWSA